MTEPSIRSEGVKFHATHSQEETGKWKSLVTGRAWKKHTHIPATKVNADWKSKLWDEMREKSEKGRMSLRDVVSHNFPAPHKMKAWISAAEWLPTNSILSSLFTQDD